MHRAQASDDVFRAIADPTRRAILDRLRAGPANAGALAADFRVSRPAISKHLRLLRSAGLVATRRRGTARLCQLKGRPLVAVSEWVRDYEVFWKESLRNLKQFVEENP